MKRVEGLLNLADDTKTLMRAVDHVFQGEVRNTGGIEPLREEAVEVRRGLTGFCAGLRVLLGESFEVFDGGAALGVLDVKIVEERFEGDVAHLRADHVEDHGALVHYDGAIVRGIGSEARGLGDGRGFFVHEGAYGEFVDGLQACFLAGILLGIESFGIAGQAITDPDIAA